MVKVLAAQCPPHQRRVPAADQAVLLRPAPGGHPGRRAAQLHGQLQGYKADFDKFSNLMEEHKPTEPPPEPTVTEPERKLSREEEISLVKTMSKQEAWSHVMSQVYEVKTKF